MDTKSGSYHSPGRGSKRTVVQKLLVLWRRDIIVEVSFEGLAMKKRKEGRRQGRGREREQGEMEKGGGRRKKRRRKELKLKPLRYKIASNYQKLNQPTSLKEPFIKETTTHPSNNRKHF